MGSTACASANAATCDAATIAASGISADRNAPIAYSGPIAISRTVAEAGASIIAAAPVKAVKPRSGTDKEATHEVIRAVVAVGRASVRVIAIIPVGASRSGADTCVNRANSNPHADADLSLRVSSSQKQNPKQCKIL